MWNVFMTDYWIRKHGEAEPSREKALVFPVRRRILSSP